MVRLQIALVSLLLFSGCDQQVGESKMGRVAYSSSEAPMNTESFPAARSAFRTNLTRRQSARESLAEPPRDLFEVVYFDSAVGDLAAYLSQPPTDGLQHPAIIWVFGGFGNSIGETAWEEASAENDQSASAFRKAGIVMMYPSFRGGNNNPGSQEGFYGEVDDVLAAAEYLSRQEFVDPNRIYLGGHSTGGSLVLLAAAASDQFRAVISFGPADNVVAYGAENLPFDIQDRKEVAMRAPIVWLDSINCPVFVFEGTKKPSNADSFQRLSQETSNPSLHFHSVKGANHFSILAPVTKLVAGKIIRDTGLGCSLSFSERELNSIKF